MADKYLTAAQLVSSINDKFGKNTVVLAKDAVGLVKPRVSTGSFQLDVALGGGYSENAITMLVGGEHTSKSWSMHRYAAHFLQKYQQIYLYKL